MDGNQQQPFQRRRRGAIPDIDDDIDDLLPPNPHQIQSLEDWLRVNGLRDANDIVNDNNSNSINATLPGINEQELFEQYKRYQQSVHEEAFADDTRREEMEKKSKQEQLELYKNDKMDLLASSGMVLSNIPLYPMAEACDTILAKASLSSTLQKKQEGSSASGFDDGADDGDKVGMEKSQAKSSNLVFSLSEFSVSSVADFVSVVMGQREVRDLRPDSIVDTCQIAHYLQATNIVDTAVEILKEKVDTGNCLSLCYLADKLSLPSLYERAVEHLMNTIETLTPAGRSNDDDGDSECCWEDLTPELQERILAIKQAVQSSMHGAANRQKLYFSSLDEYIAIFAERCQYYKERLAQAKEEHNELLEQGGYSEHNLQFVAEKIANQERRVKTLEIALAEQKKLFCNKGNN